AASLRGMESGITEPVVGVLVDRWGPRRIIFVGAIIAAIGLVLLSRTTSLLMFYGAFIFMALGTSCCGMTVLATSVANWFRKKVGLATGIAVCGFGFSGLIIPVMVKLIDAIGWRLTMAWMGAGMIAIILPLSLVFRHKPEQYGLRPDGDPIEVTVTVADSARVPDAGTVAAVKSKSKVKVSDILKNNVFWRISISFMFNILLINAAVTHVMPYLSGIGIDRELAGLVAMAIPLSSVGGRLSFGWIADRFSVKKVTGVGFVMTAIGMLCFAFISPVGAWLLIPFLFFFGIGFGGLNPLRPSLIREHFGRSNFGTIFGLVMGINMIGGIIGPAIAGWAHDNWSYQGIWLVLAVLPIVSLFILLSIGKANHVD
ncbi:MAG: MFS transporter, partial [Dehalococcoidales bacterium]|nr:MFS transporter [Dehalococcoidales bacterium]